MEKLITLIAVFFVIIVLPERIMAKNLIVGGAGPSTKIVQLMADNFTKTKARTLVLLSPVKVLSMQAALNGRLKLKFSDVQAAR